MKKLSLTVLTVVVALCMALGITLMTNTATAKADPVAGTTPMLSATKYKLSSAKDGMLIATGIKDCEDVYEVGYTFGGEVTAVNNSKTNYYTSITSGGNTWTVEDLFDDTYTGMIVWEVDYSLANSFAFTAYAKVGARDGGNLVYDPLNETIVNGTERTVSAVPKTSFDFETASDLSYVSVNIGSAEIIDKDDMVTGSSCEELGSASGNVLKATNAHTVITIGLGETVVSGTTVEFDFALTIPSKKDLCVGSNYVELTVNGQSKQYWHFDGKFRHISVTLTADADKITLSFDPTNLNFSAIGTLNESIYSETEIYIDNIETIEPLPAKMSFDFEGARDLEYFTPTGCTVSIIDQEDRAIDNHEGRDDMYTRASGNILKIQHPYTNNNTSGTVRVYLGQTIAAGTSITVTSDVGVYVASRAASCSGNNSLRLRINNNWMNYTWHGCGHIAPARTVTFTLASDANYLDITVEYNSITGADLNSDTAYIYLDNFTVTIN